MLPTGHLATGVLLGLRCSRRRRRAEAAAVMAGSVLAAVLPDGDLALPSVLDHLGVEHRLNAGRHHSWMTHTPVFWAGVSLGAWRASQSERAPGWAPEAARLVAIGSAIHITADATANTVALLWPLRRREYGLSLDRMPEEDDHLRYVRRYPATPAGWLEGALVLAAGVALIRRVS